MKFDCGFLSSTGRPNRQKCSGFGRKERQKMTLSEKAAHLKGLLEGMEYDPSTKEGKLFAAIADILEDVSLSVADLEDSASYLLDYTEELDEDLGELEREVYDIWDDEDDCDCDCGCGHGDEEEMEELECPACGAPIYMYESELEELVQLECPECGQVLNVELEDDGEDQEDK